VMIGAAKIADWPEITQFLSDTHYFMPIDIETLGGQWLVAKSDKGDLLGTIWFFAQPPHLFVDFWSASGPCAAGELGVRLEQFMRKHKIRYVHGMIACENTPAMRLATEGLGMIASGPYNRVYKEVRDNG